MLLHLLKTISSGKRHLLLLIPILLFSNAPGYAGYWKDSLKASSEKVFKAARMEDVLYKDTAVKKNKNGLQLGKCRLQEDHTNEGFFELEYKGDLDSGHCRKVVKKIMYNGEEALVLDAVTCIRYPFAGMPHKFGSLLVVIDERETTDRKNEIKIYNTHKGLYNLIKVFDFKKNGLAFTDVRMSGEKDILLKDHKGGYWKISLL